MKLSLRKIRSFRMPLSLLFAGIIFLFFIVTMGLVIGAILLFVHYGVFDFSFTVPEIDRLLLNLAGLSIIIGTLISFATSVFVLRPLNHAINAMNRLSSGDYATRLHPNGKGVTRHPSAKEFCESFNNMAEELEKTEMLRSDFVNNFSHEFKTPIVSIAGFAELLKYGNLTEEQKTEYIDVIESESRRLARMANNVLELTKVENQTILTGVTPFNLSEQIRNCFLLLQDKWTKRDLDIRIDFDEYEYRGNAGMLQQVWINLIDNAVKFTPEGGSIETVIADGKDALTVTVTNTGSEIPKESLDRIFRKFYQADESHASEGNGVGLAVVQKIVALHGGEITVKSENMVTSFAVTLPKR